MRFFGSSRFSQSSQLSWELVCSQLSPERCFESLEVTFSERIEIIGIYTIFLDSLLTRGSRYNLGVWDPLVSDELPGPLSRISLASRNWSPELTSVEGLRTDASDLKAWMRRDVNLLIFIICSWHPER